MLFTDSFSYLTLTLSLFSFICVQHSVVGGVFFTFRPNDADAAAFGGVDKEHIGPRSVNYQQSQSQQQPQQSHQQSSWQSGHGIPQRILVVTTVEETRQ